MQAVTRVNAEQASAAKRGKASLDVNPNAPVILGVGFGSGAAWSARAGVDDDRRHQFADGRKLGRGAALQLVGQFHHGALVAVDGLRVQGEVSGDKKLLVDDETQDLCEICWSPLKTLMQEISSKARTEKAENDPS